MKMQTCLKLYYKWLEEGVLPIDGLCKSLPSSVKSKFKLLEPTSDDIKVLCKEHLAFTYWGSGYRQYWSTHMERAYDFTPLRQNLVLLLAAMNGEL